MADRGDLLGDPAWRSGFATLSKHRVIHDSIEVFDSARCMFASNFPVDKAYSSFDALYRAYETVVADLSQDEKHGLFCSNSARIYRLE